MTIQEIIRYLQAGRGRVFDPEEQAVWVDQMLRSGHSEAVLTEAAKKYVERADYYVVAKFLAEAREIASDVALRERTDDVLRIGEAVSSPEEAKAFIAELRNRMGWRQKP